VAVLAARYRLRFPGARSLKDKRMALRPVVDRIRHRHHCSIAEVDDLDTPRFGTIEVAVVAGSPAVAEDRLDVLDRLIWCAADVEVVDTARWWLDDG
jgi:uncharacterized protein YlxP (DUF503 family)